jgi:hypothetical protein
MPTVEDVAGVITTTTNHAATDACTAQGWSVVPSDGPPWARVTVSDPTCTKVIGALANWAARG